jgi:hypothetical protein
VHGTSTVLNALINELGEPLQPLFIWAQGDGGPLSHPVNGGYAMYYLGKEKKALRYDVTETEDADFVRCNSVLADLCEHANDPRTSTDTRSLEAWLRDEGVAERMMSMANAGYANTLCSDMSNLSFASAAKCEVGWEQDGDGSDFRLLNSMAVVINHLKQGVQIHTNTPVTSVDFSEPVIRVSAGSRVYECGRVVVTVPVSILRDGDIAFNPPLPATKLSALNGIKMNRAMKVLLKFSRPFQPTGLHGMICADCDIPECWFREARAADGQVFWYVVGFVTSNYADRLAELSEEEVLQRLLTQLDTMFDVIGSDRDQLQRVMTHDSSRTPTTRASDVYIGGMVFDWAKQPFVRGGYGHPVVGHPVDCAARIAQPVQSKIFFAGEATCTAGATTVHAAMGTGMRAAQEVMRSFRTSHVTNPAPTGVQVYSRL